MADEQTQPKSVEEIVDNILSAEPDPQDDTEAPEGEEPQADLVEGDGPEDIDGEEPDEEEVDGESEDEPDAEGGDADPAYELSEDEITLLRRQGSTQDEIDYYTRFTPEQRTRMLRPVRAAQEKLDRVYSLPPEQRQQEAERAARESQVGEPAEQKQPAPRPSVDIDAAVKSIADAEGISEESARTLIDTASKVAEANALASFEQRQEKESVQQAQAREGDEVRRVAKALTTDVPERYSALTAQDVQDILLDPVTDGIYRAYRGQGKNVEEAMRLATDERITVRYGDRIATQKSIRRQAEAKKRRQTTPAPSSRRQVPGASAKPESLEDAMNMALDGI